MVRISCVIPIFNAERYLRETILSIMNQEFNDIEIICIDDKSTDNSKSILIELGQKDGRLKIFQMEEHSGAARCRNYGLNYVRGKYVVFLDADDIFFSSMLKTAYEAAENGNADLVVWDYLKIPVTIKGTQELYGEAIELRRNPAEIRAEDIDMRVLKLSGCIPWNKLVRTNMLKENKIFFQDLPANNDIFYAVAVTVNARKIIFLGKTLMKYYLGRTGSLTEGRRHKREYIIAAYAYTYSYISKCQHIRITNVEYLDYILEWMQRYLCDSDNENDTKQLKLADLLSNNILYAAMIEHKENRAIKLHNRTFINRVINKEYVVGENYYACYIDELEKMGMEGRKIALWGCGLLGKRFLDVLEGQRFSIDYVIDNDKDKQGCIYKSFRIYDYNQVKDKIDDILVLNSSYIKDIEKQAVGKRIISIEDL